MKRNMFLNCITGLILTVSFQNCGKGNFEDSNQTTDPQANKVVVTDDQIQNWLDKDKAFACPAIRCTNAPEGCHYEQDNALESVCPSSCGRLICKQVGGPIRLPTHPIVCPNVLCSAVPEGCHRVAAANTVKDVNGCNLSCGDIVCEDKSNGGGTSEINSIQCPAIRCMAAPANCYYRQNSTEKNACPTCGELICRKPPFGTDLQPVPTE